MVTLPPDPLNCCLPVPVHPVYIFMETTIMIYPWEKLVLMFSFSFRHSIVWFLTLPCLNFACFLFIKVIVQIHKLWLSLTQDPGIFVISKNNNNVGKKCKIKIRNECQGRGKCKNYNFLNRELMYGFCVIT